ncbi:MAG: DNA polymerase III subunit beta [Caldilineaceae bacterium]|nr:DNA polymerase III subunit beta [Caldilineaceae bacterium]
MTKGAKVEDEGAITVPARLLSEFVNSLPPERIDMELAVRTQTLHLACARYTANMKGIDAYEFPLIPTAQGQGSEEADANSVPIVDGIQIELESSGLRKMIDQVIFAASSDENRPTLTGVEVQFNNEQLSMAATDGFRLSVRRVPMSQGVLDEKVTVIVPARSLGELARISADADENRSVLVILTKARNQILFQLWGKGEEARGAFHRVELVSELIDARFPDYNATIPKSYETRTTIDTASLLKAVRVAQLFARDNANIIRISIHPANGEQGGQMRLTASSTEMGDNVSDIDAMVEGTDLDIAFSAKYLIDVLTQIDQPQVVLETTQPTRPGTLRPVGMGEEEFLHVIMPMHPPR